MAKRRRGICLSVGVIAVFSWMGHLGGCAATSLGSGAPSASADKAACVDLPPPGSEDLRCEEQQRWGKCSETWMDGYCQKSCGTCRGRSEAPRAEGPLAAFPFNLRVQGYAHSQAFLATDSQAVAELWRKYKAEFVLGVPDGGPCDGADSQCRVKFEGPSLTVSEGMGYGMLMAAYLGDWVVFERLWRYAASWLDEGARCDKACSGLMHWMIEGSSRVLGFNAASDADEDMILALYVAHKVFGDERYLEAARRQAARFRAFALDPDGMIRNGDEWGGCSSDNNVNPSYFAPAWYEVFASFDPAPIWGKAVERAYGILVDRQMFAHGYLLPTNWCTCDGKAGGGGSGTTPGEYGYEACRATFRVSLDLAWHGRERAKADIVGRQLPFFNEQIGPKSDFSRINGPYRASDGKLVPNGDGELCFQAMAATAYVHDTDPGRKARAWQQLVVALEKGIGNHRYFCSSLGMLAALFVTGNMPDPLNLP